MLPALSLKAKVLLLLTLALGLLGFSDATYLTVKHYTGGTIPCTITHGCDTVTSSAYSAIAGVPVALFGALFYLSAILLAIAYWQTQQRGLLRIFLVLSSVAFLASLGFVYLQAFVIHAWCQYCLLSALTSTLLCVVATLSWRHASTTSAAA